MISLQTDDLVEHRRAREHGADRCWYNEVVDLT